MPVRRRPLGFSLLLLLAACAPKPAPVAAVPAVDSAAVKAAAADLWQRWAAAEIAGDAAALANMVTDSTRIDMRGVPPMLGRETWKASAETAFKERDVTAMEIHPEITVPISNDLAYEAGEYSQAATIGNNHTADRGRYAAALQRGADGKWRVSYIMVFADSTAPAK